VGNRLNLREIYDADAHERNQHKVKGDEVPCLVCGKGCKDNGKAVWVHLHEGGSVIVDEEEADRLNAEGHSNADLGGYPIGPDCYKKHKAKLQPFVVSTGG